MKSKIYCRTVAKEKQAFFITVSGKEYFLFEQSYRKSVKEFFSCGVDIDKINNYTGAHSAAVRKTLDKLPAFVKYVEKEHELEIYEKSKVSYKTKKQKPYKREQFNWKKFEIA